MPLDPIASGAAFVGRVWNDSSGASGTSSVLNDDASTRQELVRLILEDPSLAGNVLVRANSAWYRTSPEPVESLDRAVRMLGTDGLKRLLATAILQPVFRLPKGYFDSFAPITWEQAQRVAAAAVAHANESGGGVDPFVAQLLGVLVVMSRIVLFRLTMDEYRIMQEHPHRGDEVLAPLTWLREARLGVRHHHERFDGTGYPDGLAGEAIPLIARIIAVVDTFDAVVSRRSYRDARGSEHAAPHAPQCASSYASSASQPFADAPSQSSKPASQLISRQLPAMHALVA